MRHYLLLTYTSPLLSLPFTIALSAAPLLRLQSILTGYGLHLNGGQRGMCEEEHWRPGWDCVYDITGITCTEFEVGRIVGGKANIAAHLWYGNFKVFDSHLPNSSGWTWCDLIFVQFVCSTPFSATWFFQNSVWSSEANIIVFIVLSEIYMCCFMKYDPKDLSMVISVCPVYESGDISPLSAAWVLFSLSENTWMIKKFCSTHHTWM